MREYSSVYSLFKRHFLNLEQNLNIRVGELLKYRDVSPSQGLSGRACRCADKQADPKIL